MLNTLLGSKQKMGQTFVEDTRVPVTWIKTGPCLVTQIKTDKTDGYFSVQLGFGDKKKTIKSLKGHIKSAISIGDSDKEKSKINYQKLKTAPRFLREVRVNKQPDIKIGDIIDLSDVFKKGDLVQISGISKGKGFAGVVKRWGFKGGPKTHGQSDRQRSPGSIGQGTSPGRVWKGKKMAGRMGNQKVTVKNLIVVEIDPENNQMAVSGPVPGVKNGLLEIKKLASGKLEELIEETPQPEMQVQQEEEVKEGSNKTENSSKEESEVKEEK